MPVVCCMAGDSLARAVGLLWSHELHRLSVVDDDMIVRGSVSAGDICKAIQGTGKRLMDLRVRDVIAGPCPGGPIDTPPPAPWESSAAHEASGT